MTSEEVMYLLIGAVITLLGMVYCISEIREAKRVIKELDEIERYAKEYMVRNFEEDAE